MTDSFEKALARQFGAAVVTATINHGDVMDVVLALDDAACSIADVKNSEYHEQNVPPASVLRTDNSITNRA
jgi:hypothetical protein